MRIVWKLRIFKIIGLPILILAFIIDGHFSISSTYILIIYFAIILFISLAEANFIKKLDKQGIIFFSKTNGNNIRDIIIGICVVIFIALQFGFEKIDLFFILILSYNVMNNFLIKSWDFIIEDDKIILKKALFPIYRISDIKSHYITHTGRLAISLKNKRNDIVTNVSIQNLDTLTNLLDSH